MPNSQQMEPSQYAGWLILCAALQHSQVPDTRFILSPLVRWMRHPHWPTLPPATVSWKLHSSVMSSTLSYPHLDFQSILEKKELDLKVKSLTEKVKTQGRQSAELSQTCKLLEKECKNLKGQREQEKERSSILQAAISHDFVSSLEGQDEKAKYYTGLPTYKCLKAVFDFTFPPTF